MTHGNASASQAAVRTTVVKAHCGGETNILLVTAKLSTATAATHAFDIPGSSGTKQCTLIGSERHVVQFKPTVTIILTNSSSRQNAHVTKLPIREDPGPESVQNDSQCLSDAAVATAKSKAQQQLYVCQHLLGCAMYNRPIKTKSKKGQSVAAPDQAGRRTEGCCRAGSMRGGQQGSPQLAAAGAG